jgi:osmotically inducible lipoprotein OsmB
MFIGKNFTSSGGLRIVNRRTGWIARLGAAIFAVAMALSMMGCYGPPMGPRTTDTLIGGAAGAGGGALLGSAVGAPGTGAIVGGLLGAGGGYLIGNAQANSWRNGYYYRPYY